MSDAAEPYEVVAVASMYGGKWLVIRKNDQRLLTECDSVYEAAAWIRTWGDEKALKKKGRPLAPKFIEHVREQFPDFLA